MENNYVSGSKGPSRRVFLSASAVTAVAAPIVSQAAPASAAPASAAPAKAAPAGARSANYQLEPDEDLFALLGEIDPGRIQATIQRLVQFGTRHTASSLTDPVRGIGAATAWVTQQMQAIAATSNGNMTVQQQTFLQQPVVGRLTAPTNITNCIATLQGT